MLHFSRRLQSHGFTLVELMVVVVVIVILAGITIYLYDSVALKTQDTSLKNDLTTAIDQLKIDIQKGIYPATAADVNGGAGFKVASGTTITYMRKPYGYCMYASNPDASQTLMVRSLDGVIKAGTCGMEMSLLAGDGTATGYIDGSAFTARFNSVPDNGIGVNNAGELYVSDYTNKVIRKVLIGDGSVSTYAGTGGTACTTGTGATAQIGVVTGLALDRRTKTIYFVGCTYTRIFKMTSDGTVSLLVGGGATTNCTAAAGTSISLTGARSLMLGSDGYLYYAEYAQQKICKVNTTTGATSLLAGSTTGFNDATGASAQFNSPWGVAMDSQGNTFVTDQSNNRVRKITPAGVVSTFAGSGVAGTANGTGTAAQINAPKGIAIDRFDNIYVSDAYASIRMITPAQVVTNIVDGTTGSTNLNWPGGSFASSFTIDSRGIMYGLTMRGVVKIIL